ncbi:tyrosine-type recombinase/integrase [Xanthocytophaga agilis]|uniref:Tyrosine-type recombinase/integrase n=1 Tax=Xanthocytophaga agilis TaxID=3048010 RepID=A0AAE3R8I5_9BACT|nr:tyrosine-type recombinase/integrase [Xanthocytophaga agilis]MDJ1505205.1 tyrosine-type recombinase/integrase [Xanthocytophaga agilis]
MSILYWLRKNQVNRKGECPLWCTISIEQSKAEFSCKITIDPVDWDQKNQIATGPLAGHINVQLELITKKLLEIKLASHALEKTVTPALIKDQFLGKTISRSTFLEMFEKCLKRKTTLSQTTKKRYERRLKHIEAFLKLQRKDKILPEEFTPGLLEELEHYLRTEKKIKSQEYLYRYIDSVREVLRFCKTKQIPIHLGALDYKISKGKPKTPIYMTEQQISDMAAFDHQNFHLIKARDLALFQRYTGFSFGDMMSFDYEKDVIIANNKRWIKKARGKSGQIALLPFFDEALKILQAYEYTLPKISNQKYNAYLGTIGELINLPFKLTSHVMRKTAGALWLQSGVPYALVSSMLGHSNIATTQKHYVRVDLTVLQAYFK